MIASPAASPAATAQAQPLSPNDKLRKTAEDFQAVFLSEMFSHMFDSIDVDPMFGGGNGEKIFRGMMVQEYGKSMAKSAAGAGMTDQIQKFMLRMQHQK